MTEYRAAGVDASEDATTESWVSNVFDTRAAAEAFRDEHLEGSHPGSTAWVERSSGWVAQDGSTRAAW